MSVGCHRMIRDGQASLVSDTDDICALLAPLGAGPELPTTGAQRPLDDLEDHLLELREAMPGRRAIQAAELAVLSGQPLPATIAALSELELLGLVKRDDAGAWRLRRPA